MRMKASPLCGSASSPLASSCASKSSSTQPAKQQAKDIRPGVAVNTCQVKVGGTGSSMMYSSDKKKNVSCDIICSFSSKLRQRFKVRKSCVEKNSSIKIDLSNLGTRHVSLNFFLTPERTAEVHNTRNKPPTAAFRGRLDVLR